MERSANRCKLVGKSVVCAKIIEHIQENTTSTAAFFFCGHQSSSQKQAKDLFRNIAAQLLRANISMSPYILETFASNGLRPTIKNLQTIVEKLVECLISVRIVVDGIDESDPSDQRDMLTDLLKMRSLRSCKILFSSRRQPSISKFLQTKPTIKLENHADSVNNTISCLVHARLGDLRRKFGEGTVNELEGQIIEKADG